MKAELLHTVELSLITQLVKLEREAFGIGGLNEYGAGEKIAKQNPKKDWAVIN